MKNTSAKVAQMIREELKKNFPNIKFSVTSKLFAGGDSVSIHYNNGVPESEIEAIVNKYQYGNFDGMTDMYEYDNVNDSIPQAKYIQVNRSLTDDKKAEIEKSLRENWEVEENGWLPSPRCWIEQMIWREAVNLNL